MKKIALDVNDLVERYNRGESVQKIAKDLSISRYPIQRALASAGIELRNRAIANAIRMNRMTSEQRKLITRAANAAATGSKASEQQLIARALTNETRCKCSKYEIALGSMLTKLDIPVTFQKAAWIYNIDLAICESRIAVEIFGGNWHTAPKHAARYKKRIEYLIRSGWLPIVVWVGRDFPLTNDSANYIHAVHKVRCFDKAHVTQEHVIRGDAKTASTSRFNPDNGAFVNGSNSRNASRDRNGRFA